MARVAAALTAGATALLTAACAPLQPPSPEPETQQPAPEGRGQASALQTYLEQQAQIREDPEEFHRPWIAVLPFEDDSGFREGVWDLVDEMPRLLSAEMERSSAWRVIPYEAVSEAVGAKQPKKPWPDASLQRLGSTLRADLLVTGILLDYNLERLEVGDPLIGGYKSYKGLAEIELQLTRAADLSRMGSAHSLQETLDRGLGIDLLGKPREQDYQFVNLGSMAFGSEEFRGTAIGEATVMAMDELIQELFQLVRPQGIRIASGAPEILSVFGEEIFINVGSENGVHKGYRFAVFPAGDPRVAAPQRIGVVEVEDIIGARVSRVRALAGVDQLEVGDRLELIMAEPEPSD